MRVVTKAFLANTLALGLCIPTASAQQSRKPPGSEPAGVVPKGSSPEFLKVINALSGHWSIAETDAPRQHTPTATRSGTEVWYTATGGITLIEEYNTKAADGDAHDTALIWWDGKAQRILGLWCADINDQGCSGFTVRWERSDIIMSGEWESQGKRLAWREVFVFAGPSSFTQTLYIGSPGRNLERASVIQATRGPGPFTRLPGG